MKKTLIALAFFALPLAASATTFPSFSVPSSGSDAVIPYTSPINFSNYPSRPSAGWSVMVFGPNNIDSVLSALNPLEQGNGYFYTGSFTSDVFCDGTPIAPNGGSPHGYAGGNTFTSSTVDLSKPCGAGSGLVYESGLLQDYGTYTFLILTDSSPVNNGMCEAVSGAGSVALPGTLAQWEACAGTEGTDWEVAGTYDYEPPPPPVTNGVQQLIDAANQGFYDATDPTIQSFTSGMGDLLLKPWLGSGLALLFELRYWIMALIIIAAIVFFSSRAFQFFRR